MKKKIIIISIFIIITLMLFYLYLDYKNDTKYFQEENFVENTNFLNKNFQEEDYCKNGTSESEGFLCEIYYTKSFLHPLMGMNIDFDDNSFISYSIIREGLFKNEKIDITIILNSSEEEVDSQYCVIDKDFKVVDNKDNSAYCYTKDYNKFIDEHRKYIDESIDKFNSYYDNFNLARNF